MAYDLLRGPTPSNWSRKTSSGTSATSLGALPLGALGYAPEHWITAKQAEDKVAELMKSGGLFGTKLPREIAERKTLEFLRKGNIGIMSGTMGSWLLSEKEQNRILNKIDDVRYDMRLVSRRVGIGLGCLAGALGVLGAASIFRTASQDPARHYGQLNRFGR